MIELTEAHLRKLLTRAWNEGFDATGEGCNGEYCTKQDAVMVDKHRHEDVIEIVKYMWAYEPEE